jgi:hypothetical protein
VDGINHNIKFVWPNKKADAIFFTKSFEISMKEMFRLVHWGVCKHGKEINYISVITEVLYEILHKHHVPPISKCPEAHSPTTVYSSCHQNTLLSCNKLNFTGIKHPDNSSNLSGYSQSMPKL